MIGKTLRTFSFRANTRLIGRAQVLLSAIGFGAIGTFAKFAYASGIDSALLLALRFLVAGVALWAYFLAFKRDVIRIGLKELATSAALGLAGYGIFSSLVFRAFESTSASVASLLFFSYPAFVIVIDWVATRRRPDTPLLLGALVILCGIGVGVLGTLSKGLTIGLVYAVAGAAWYAAYVVATRRLLKNLRTETLALYVTSFAAAGFWLLGGPVTLHQIGGRALAAILALGLISTVMALLSFFSGLEKLGSAEASQIGTAELIVSLSLAAFVLGETITMPLLLGATMIFAGILTGQIKTSDSRRDCPDDMPC